MEELKVRRLPVINKNKRMIGMLSLGNVGHSAPAVEIAKMNAPAGGDLWKSQLKGH